MTATGLASRIASALRRPRRSAETPHAAVRERGGWLWCVAGPEIDRLGNRRLEVVLADPDNYLRRWSCVADAASSSPSDWKAAVEAIADGIDPVGTCAPPRLPEAVPGIPDCLLPWHAANYVTAEFADGRMLNGRIRSPGLAARVNPPEPVRAADRVMAAKPGAEVGSKTFWIMHDPALGAAARQAAEARPWTAFLPPAEFAAIVRRTLHDGRAPDARALADVLSRTGPWKVTPAAIARFDAFGPTTAAALRDERILLDLMSSIPPSWLFSTDEDFVYLSRVGRAVDALCPLDAEDVATFLGASKGRFRDFVSSALGTDPDDPEAAVARLTDIADFIDYVRDEVVTDPLRHEVVTEAVGGLRARPDGRHRRHLTATAKLAATPDGGLGRLRELSDRWHANLSDYPFPMSVNGRAPWPRLADDWTGPNRIVVTVIADAAALEEEALAMRHCVRSFRRRCETGESSVVSLRRDGARLSTAEIGYEDRGTRFAVRQHRGPSNAEPPRECVQALAAWHRALSGGRIPINPDVYRPGAFHVRDIPEFDEPAGGPAAFRGIVERRLSDMEWPEFRAAIREIDRTARRRIRAGMRRD